MEGRTRLHGAIPPPGVWSHGGQARLTAKDVSIGRSLYTIGGCIENSNSFSSNGMVAGALEGVTSKDVHLGPHAVPLPIERNDDYSSRPRQLANGNASSPGRRISALEFDDGVLLNSPSQLELPCRVSANGAWRLHSSLSAAQLPLRPYYGGSCRKVILNPADSFVQDNLQVCTHLSPPPSPKSPWQSHHASHTAHASPRSSPAFATHPSCVSVKMLWKRRGLHWLHSQSDGDLLNRDTQVIYQFANVRT